MRVFLFIAGLIALGAVSIGVFFGIFNYFEKKAWDDYVAVADGRIDGTDSKDFLSQEVRGKNYIRLRDVIPPVVRDDLNFAFTPFWEEFFGAATGESSKEWFQVCSERNWFATNELTAQTILAPQTIQDILKRAGDSSGELSPKQAALQLQKLLESGKLGYEKLKADLQTHPLCRYPIQWKRAEQNNLGLYPHLLAIQQIANYSLLQAKVHFVLDENDQACEAILFTLKLANTLSREPVTHSILTKSTVVRMALEVLREGLSEQKISDAYLTHFQKYLTQIDFWNDLYLVVLGSRAMVNAQLMSHPDATRAAIIDCNPVFPNVMAWLPFFKYYRPIGLYYKDLLEYNLMTDALLVSMDREDKHFVRRELEDAFERLQFCREQNEYYSWHWAVKLFAPEYEKIFAELAYTRYVIVASEAACGMELYYREKRRIPFELGALLNFLNLNDFPRDWVNDRPPQISLHLDDTGYDLRNNGWDRKDDQGKPGETIFSGDWVWSIDTIRQ